MTTDIVTALVHEKDVLLGELRRFQAAAAVMVMQHGKPKGARIDYRISKAALDKLNHQVIVKVLKTGGLVVSVTAVDE